MEHRRWMSRPAADPRGDIAATRSRWTPYRPLCPVASWIRMPWPLNDAQHPAHRHLRRFLGDGRRRVQVAINDGWSEV